MKRADLVRKLTELGCELIHHGGCHDWYQNKETKVCQPHVAEVFTNVPGVLVSIADTVKGFAEILDGKLDDVPEGNFYMKGGIESVPRD